MVVLAWCLVVVLSLLCSRVAAWGRSLDGSMSHVEGDGATVCVVGGGQSGAARDGVVRSVAGGALVETVLGRGEVVEVGDGGVVDSVDGEGNVRRVEVVRCGGRVEGAAARVENMSGRADAWAEIGVVDYFATARRERGNPVVGRLGPYSRVHFESHNAREVLACIGRVDVGALEAGLVDVTYGSRRESLLPLLRERGGVVE